MIIEVFIRYFKVLSTISVMGHAQTSTTLNIYTHAFQEGDWKAAAALENILQKHA